MPWHDEDYGSRSGYNEEFFDLSVPEMPEPADSKGVAKAKDGSAILLHYTKTFRS
jgi:hypothetical protein